MVPKERARCGLQLCIKSIERDHKKIVLDLDFEEYLNLKNDIAKLHNFLATVQFVALA
jgi:hypothetical protein